MPLTLKHIATVRQGQVKAARAEDAQKAAQADQDRPRLNRLWERCLNGGLPSKELAEFAELTHKLKGTPLAVHVEGGLACWTKLSALEGRFVQRAEAEQEVAVWQQRQAKHIESFGVENPRVSQGIGLAITYVHMYDDLEVKIDEHKADNSAYFPEIKNKNDRAVAEARTTAKRYLLTLAGGAKPESDTRKGFDASLQVLHDSDRQPEAKRLRNESMLRLSLADARRKAADVDLPGAQATLATKQQEIAKADKATERAALTREASYLTTLVQLAHDGEIRHADRIDAAQVALDTFLNEPVEVDEVEDVLAEAAPEPMKLGPQFDEAVDSNAPKKPGVGKAKPAGQAQPIQKPKVKRGPRRHRKKAAVPS